MGVKPSKRKDQNNMLWLSFGAIIIFLLGFGVAIITLNNQTSNDIRSDAAPRTSEPSAISLNEDPTTLTFGSKVTFTTIVNGLKGAEYPLVHLECKQGDKVVYGQLDYPSTTFVLGGGSSAWWENKGAATCIAYLKAYGGKSKGYDTIRTLAQTPSFESK